MRRAVAMCLAMCLVVACVDVIGPPSNAVRFTPSVRYRGWWALVEACSGHTADFDAVRWYVLPNDSTFQLEGQTVNGAFYASGNQIVLADGEQLDGVLVRHEMLHAILPPLTKGHPREYFLDRCGDIVVCEGHCESDAGGPIATSWDALVVASSTIRVGTILAPNPVSVSADSGWFPLTVTVTNNAPEAVRVPVPLPVSGAVGAFSYEYVIVPTTGGQRDSLGYEALDGEFVYFAPAGQAGATRRFVFDRTPILRGVAPGDYDVTGKLITVESSPTVLHINR